MIVDRINSGLRRVPPWLLYIVGAAWAAWLFYLGLTGQLGAEPINRLEREYGAVALKLLIVGLAVSPLRRWPGLNLLRFRRAIGVTAFFFVLAHFAVFAVLDLGAIGRVWEEIVKRPYITVGAAALLLLVPAAITSNNLAVRRLGAASWKKVHLLTFPAAILAAVHFLWLSKGFQIEPLVYLGLILALLALRLKSRRRSAMRA